MTKPLQVQSLSHRYDDQATFINVSLDVEAGELVTLLGASGSGKSTLLRAIAGFTHPHAGQILIGGQLVHDGNRSVISPQARRVGMVFQDYALFPAMSVRDNIGFGIHKDPSRAERTEQLLELLELSSLGDRSPSQLSGGQQQRVALARALAPRPALLLLDEPFANLDAALRSSVGYDVRALLQAENVSGLMVTHDRGEALGLSDRVAVLGPKVKAPHEVGLLQIGSPQTLYEAPCCHAVATLTGSVTELQGTGVGEHAETALGNIPLIEPLKGPCTIFLRPEAASFAPSADGVLEVTHHAYRGGLYEIALRGPQGPLLLQSTEATPPEVGQRGQLLVVTPQRAVQESI